MFLKERVAIVTAGGGPGIGRAISLALAREGAAVVVAELDPKRASSVAAEIEDSGGVARAVPTDVSRQADVVRMVKQTASEFGRIDILINHAGISSGGLIEDVSEEVWDRTLGVHLKGTFLCSQAVVPHMKRAGWGRIVSTSSRAAYKQSHAGLGAYAAAKAGIIGLSRALALELGPHGITVNCVAPGLVSGSGMGAATNRPPQSPEERQQTIARENQAIHPIREVRPDEIAGAVLYLVGPYSERVTGTVLHVNGGSYLPA